MKIPILFIASSAFLLADTLPPDAEALKALRDAKIAEIDRIYAAELDKLQKKHMKDGSLAGANAIEKEIARVVPNPLEPSTKTGGATAAEDPTSVQLTKRGLENRLEGMTFITDSNNWLNKMTFVKGRIIHNPNAKGQGRSAAFKAVDGSTITLQWDNKPVTISFSPDLSTCMRGNITYARE